MMKSLKITLKKITLIKPVKVWMLVTPIFLLLIFFSRNDHRTLFSVFVLSAAVYLFLAVLHHIQDKTLRLEIVIEYLLIAALGLIILYDLLI